MGGSEGGGGEGEVRRGFDGFLVVLEEGSLFFFEFLGDEITGPNLFCFWIDYYFLVDKERDQKNNYSIIQ